LFYYFCVRKEEEEEKRRSERKTLKSHIFVDIFCWSCNCIFVVAIVVFYFISFFCLEFFI